jgi:hypothetical protein
MKVTGENIRTLRKICPSATLFTSWSVGGFSVNVKYIQLQKAFIQNTSANYESWKKSHQKFVKNIPQCHEKEQVTEQ